MSEWISKKDSLPLKEIQIIICNDERKVMVGLYGDCASGDKFFTTNFEQYLLPGNVTHWMYMPEPPDNLLPKSAESVDN